MIQLILIQNPKIEHKMKDNYTARGSHLGVTINSLIFISLSLFMTSCDQPRDNQLSGREQDEAINMNLWPNYNAKESTLKIWSPEADSAIVLLYEKGHEGSPLSEETLVKQENGIWSVTLAGDLNGTYYTFKVKYGGDWLKETPGIYATAVGVDGNRAMILDLKKTDPIGWANDVGPILTKSNDAVIYEMHVRDMTIHQSAGSSFPGKYLGLVEEGTKNANGLSTGIDHLKELGISHVHLLPSYDHYSIRETKLDSAQFNWGYDPKNYNVPEGSFSSDPYHAETRIKEFKQMVKRFHDEGIGVVLDVVYNHTGRNEDSNFNLEYPNYYYRFNEDGSWSNASACGNETASEKEMMRKYIIESVSYWAEEYHLDGFRFDLMGIHDIETMNQVTEALKKINPNILIYGEGWTAGSSPLAVNEQALKKNTHLMSNVSAFSDDIRDGLKGSVFEHEDRGFVSGKPGMEESIKFGVVASIQHPQIDYSKVNYSDSSWTIHPWQAVSYASCHDNHSLFDKLTISRPDASVEEIIKMHLLANSIVFTSQGVSFLHAGVDMLRTKQGVENSFESPDSINQIDWERKSVFKDVFDYYKSLISLRKEHPAFRMNSGQEVRDNLRFLEESGEGLIGFEINGAAVNDDWNNIRVYYNGKADPYTTKLPDGDWRLGFDGLNALNTDDKKISGNFIIPPITMTIIYKN